MARKGRYSGKSSKEAYKEWHWGLPAHREIEWPDTDYPDRMVEIGRLLELHVNPDQGKPYKIILSEPDYEDAFVTFDQDHPDQRIYIAMRPRLQSRMRHELRKLRRGNPPKRLKLAALAKQIGSRHGTSDYPDIAVEPLGRLTHVVYFTDKKGDGLSGYIHEMGEEGGITPAIAVDDEGRLWLAGGSYDCPPPGITR